MVNLDFRNLIWELERIGLLEVILPFLLIFTIIFAVLQKSKILDTGNEGMMKKYNIVVAIVMAFAVIIPHVTGAYQGFRSPVDVINNALPAISVVIIAIIMFLLLLGVFGKRFDIGENGGVSGFVTFTAIGTVLTIFAISAGWFDRGLPDYLQFIRVDPTLQALIVVILVFGLLIKFITSEPSKDKDDGFGKKLADGIKSSLKD